MEISERWNDVIKEMKKKGMTVNRIILSLGHDKGFFYDNKLDYGDPPWEELEQYEKDLKALF